MLLFYVVVATKAQYDEGGEGIQKFVLSYIVWERENKNNTHAAQKFALTISVWLFEPPLQLAQNEQ